MNKEIGQNDKVSKVALEAFSNLEIKLLQRFHQNASAVKQKQLEETLRGNNNSFVDKNDLIRNLVLAQLLVSISIHRAKLLEMGE